MMKVIVNVLDSLVNADWLGNCYIADTGNNAIRKLTTSGEIITLIGEARYIPLSCAQSGSDSELDAESRSSPPSESAAIASDKTGLNPYPNYLNCRNPTEFEVSEMECYYRNGILLQECFYSNNDRCALGVREHAKLFLPKAVAYGRDGSLYIGSNRNQ